MKINDIGLIEMEQSGLPGGYGDACAESSRYVTLSVLTNSYKNDINLYQLITNKGIVRYPSPPSPWNESDTSSDQIAPLISALSVSKQGILNRVIYESKWQTGNGNFITLGLLGNLRRAEKSRALWISDIALLLQLIAFKLPYTWNNGIIKNTDTSDYLNFVNSLAFAHLQNPSWISKLVKKLIKKDTILNKVKSYYKPEPNSAWIINLYEKALEVLYV